MYKSQITTDVSISNIRIFQVLLFMNAGTFIFKTIHSLNRSFVPWNFRSRDSSFKPFRPFPPRTIRSLDRSFYRSRYPPWTFPATDHSFICQHSSTWSTYKEGTA